MQFLCQFLENLLIALLQIKQAQVYRKTACFYDHFCNYFYTYVKNMRKKRGADNYSALQIF